MVGALIESEQLCNLSVIWQPGAICELTFTTPLVTCTNQTIKRLAAALKRTVITANEYATVHSQVRVVVHACELGTLRIYTPWQTWFKVADISQDTSKCALTVADTPIKQFTLIPISAWQLASIEARNTSLVSCGYLAVSRCLSTEDELFAEMVQLIYDRYMLESRPTVWLLDDRLRDQNKLVISTQGCSTRLPSKIRLAVREILHRQDVTLVDHEGVPVKKIPKCLRSLPKNKLERPKKRKRDLPVHCVLVYPALRMRFRAAHVDCIHCKESRKPMKRHDAQWKCVSCDETFKSVRRADLHYEECHKQID